MTDWTPDKALDLRDDLAEALESWVTDKFARDDIAEGLIRRGWVDDWPEDWAEENV